MSVEKCRIHRERVVVLCERAFRVDRASLEHALTGLDNSLPLLLGQFRRRNVLDGEPGIRFDPSASRIAWKA